MRAVLDPNILVSALLSGAGAPARVLHAWVHGSYELIVSPLLLTELERVLDYPKIRKRINSRDASAYVAWLTESASLVSDPEGPPRIRSSDAGDDYLIALAESETAALVSGDTDVLALARSGYPIYTAAEFLELLERS